jgi:DNA-binding NarL/FixJ family response regulator
MKDSASNHIIEAIRTVLGGGIYVSQAMTNRFLEVMSGKGPDKYSFPLQRLSDREIEVFERIGQGKNTHQIAEQLRISPRTVDAHRRHIREKLRLGDSTEVLSYAIKWVETGKAE